MAQTKEQKRLGARDRMAAEVVRLDTEIETCQRELRKAAVERQNHAVTDGPSSLQALYMREGFRGRQDYLRSLRVRREIAMSRLKDMNALCGFSVYLLDRNNPALLLSDTCPVKPIKLEKELVDG